MKWGRMRLPASTSRTAPDSHTPSSLVKGAAGASVSRMDNAPRKTAAASTPIRCAPGRLVIWMRSRRCGDGRRRPSGAGERDQRDAKRNTQAADDETLHGVEVKQHMIEDSRRHREIVAAVRGARASRDHFTEQARGGDRRQQDKIAVAQVADVEARAG